MNKIFHLATCKTCQKIIDQLDLEGKDVALQNIKENNISEEELDFLMSKKGSYEALFNRRAMKYRSLGLKEQTLTEEDYKKWILQEYTFLKRPVIVLEDKVFVGNSKKEVEGAKAVL